LLKDYPKKIARYKGLVGFDLMEVCPGEGPTSCAFSLAKLAYKLISCAVPQEGG